MASVPNIFEDPRGAELETTAGEARAGAPTTRIARQVETNANLEHQAAEQAASVAKTKGPRLTGEKATSVDKMRNIPGETVKEPLDQAVEEGKRDVADIQAASAEKLVQVKEMAAQATSSAQQYLTTGIGQSKGTQSHDTMSSAGGILPTLQTATSGLVDTATSTLASAKATATSAIDVTTAGVGNLLGTAGTQGAQLKDMPASSTGISATSAPLESGLKKLDTMYPPRSAKDIAKNEPRRTIN